MGKAMECWDTITMEARPKVRYWVPCAAMDAVDLVNEIELLYQRGFGGVEVVTLGTTPEEIQKGKDGWGTKHWNEMVQVIADTTKRLGMSMDLANGPMWPISMPTIKNAKDEAVLCELTYGVLSLEDSNEYHGPLPVRRVIHQEGTPTLVSVCAYLEMIDTTNLGQSTKILIKDSYVDLTEKISHRDGEAYLDVSLPHAKENTHWLIFAFYRQPAVQKTGSDQYYVIDHLSEVGVKACESYWDQIFRENTYPSMESFFCDSLEYKVAMDWTPKLPEVFEEWRGYKILPYLPIIGLKNTYPEGDIPGYRFEDQRVSDSINHDYLETITRCYCEHHLALLEKMAKKYGKSVRYQVAYNKPFEVERCPLFVGVPENEALGRPAMDYLKTMASAVHLGRKKRYSFECAAEFGNGYGQTYEDLFWWVKRSLMSGMNAQVLHGASYSGGYHGENSVHGQIPGVSWPGYEGFSKFVSNEWNRTLSVRDARSCLDTIARLNTIFLKKAKVDCAIYRQSYLNDGLGSDFCFAPEADQLMNLGFTYESVSPYLLDLPVCNVENGMLDPEGVGYQCLIISEIKQVSSHFLSRVRKLIEDGLTVIWIGDCPKDPLYFSEWCTNEKKEHWERMLSEGFHLQGLIHVQSWSEVAEALDHAGIHPYVKLDGRKDLVTATRVDEDKKITYHAVYAYNRVKYTPEEMNPEEMACGALYHKGTTKSTYQRAGKGSRQKVQIQLRGVGAVSLLDPWSQTERPLSFTRKDGYMVGEVWIEEDELLVFALDSSKSMDHKQPDYIQPLESAVSSIPIQFDSLELQEFVPDEENETSFLRSHFTKQIEKISLDELKPWCRLKSSLSKFAGRGTYYGTFTIDVIDSESRYILYLGNVSDTFRVWVNGKETAFPDQSLKRVEITEWLCNGQNELCVEVTSNLYNRLQGREGSSYLPFTLPYHEKDYGIFADEEHPVCIERWK